MTLPTDITRITLSSPLDYLDYRVGSGGSVEIYDICVGSVRGIGRGRALVDELVRRVRGQTDFVWAMTRMSNTGAAAFYRACGFKLHGVIFSFHRDTGEDALLYGKIL